MYVGITHTATVSAQYTGFILDKIFYYDGTLTLALDQEQFILVL